MNYLEFTYIGFLLLNITSLNKEFNEGFALYNEKHPPKSNYEFYFDYELAQYMARLLQQGNHFKCPSYEELESLFRYIQIILYFQNIERLKYQGDKFLKLVDEPNTYINELDNYGLGDSKLMKENSR